MRCPVCKAENAQGPQCRRCRADLGLLFALEEQRDRALRAARSALARGAWRQARAEAARADEMRHDEESGRLVAVTRLLAGDFAGAWQAYRAWRHAQDGNGAARSQ